LPVIRYTGPMRMALTADVQMRLERSLAEFPELAHRSITVGLTKSADGIAEIDRMTIRLNVRKRRAVSYFTIGHELTHLLQPGGLGLIPGGEVQCDVWTLARSELFLDAQPTYLCPGLWSRENWLQHAHAVRHLCRLAIVSRATNRRYLVWLARALKEHVGPTTSWTSWQPPPAPEPPTPYARPQSSPARASRVQRRRRQSPRFRCTEKGSSDGGQS
jgi:hypothetical protein